MPLVLVHLARIAIFFIAFWSGFAPASAQDVQTVPPLTAHVMDQTGTLEPAQREALEAKLRAFEQARGAQVVMLLLPSTQPEDIGERS